MIIPHTDRVTATMRDVLKRLPISVNALAKLAGVAQPVLWRILNGERRATAATAAKIAAALESWGADATTAAKALRRAIRTQGRKR
jgi:transcriptional regulator with XRE-family HTH domain